MRKSFLMTINNIPLHIEDKYIVVRLDHTELWYYGQYNDEEFAYKVADVLGNAFVVEVE